jgi:hypothetical protein
MKSAVIEDETKYTHNQRRGCHGPKLEQYVCALKVLACNGPIKLGLFLHLTDFSCATAIENLGFLVELDLVEKRADKYGLSYSITARGERVVSFWEQPTKTPTRIATHLKHRKVSLKPL